jgi:hypothetical protein
MPQLLPDRPNAGHLKGQAKDLLKAHNARHLESCELLSLLRRFQGKSRDEIIGQKVTLSECQFALALSYGCRNWSHLIQRCSPKDVLSRSGMIKLQHIHESFLAGLKTEDPAFECYGVDSVDQLLFREVLMLFSKGNLALTAQYPKVIAFVVNPGLSMNIAEIDSMLFRHLSQAWRPAMRIELKPKGKTSLARMKAIHREDMVVCVQIVNRRKVSDLITLLYEADVVKGLG